MTVVTYLWLLKELKQRIVDDQDTKNFVECETTPRLFQRGDLFDITQNASYN